MFTANVSSVADAPPAPPPSLPVGQEARAPSDKLQSRSPVALTPAPPSGVEQVGANLQSESSNFLSKDDLEETVEQLQATVDFVSRRVEFKIDEGNVQVLVVDRETEEVIRAIPPDEIMSLAQRLGEAFGLIIDTDA